MAKYIIIKDKDDNRKLYMEREINGYKFKPKMNDKYLKVNDVKVMDEEMIDNILTIKFNKMFKKLLTISLKVINSDDADEGDTQLALDEVEMVREILLNKYQKFLNQEKETLFLKKLRVIENQLRMKQVMIKEKAMMQNYQEIMEEGRGR